METPETVASAADTGTAPASEPVQPSFTDALTAEQPTFTQADRDAAIAEARTAWEKEQGEKYGWAKDIHADDGPRLNKLYAELAQDPIGAAMRMLQAAGQNPANHAAILSQIQSFLPAGAAPAATMSGKQDAPSEPPGPDLVIPAHVGADGQIVPERKLYSAEGMAAREDWLRQNLSQSFDEKLKPVLSWQEQQQQAQQQAEMERRADETAGKIISDLSSRPLFKEHHKEIAAEIDRIAKASYRGVIPDADLAAVARDAYHNVVYPKLSAQGQSDALADHARRASASTARPTSGRAATPSTTAPATLAEALRAGLDKTSRSA